MMGGNQSQELKGGGSGGDCEGAASRAPAAGESPRESAMEAGGASSQPSTTLHTGSSSGDGVVDIQNLANFKYTVRDEIVKLSKDPRKRELYRLLKQHVSESDQLSKFEVPGTNSDTVGDTGQTGRCLSAAEPPMSSCNTSAAKGNPQTNSANSRAGTPSAKTGDSPMEENLNSTSTSEKHSSNDMNPADVSSVRDHTGSAGQRDNNHTSTNTTSTKQDSSKTNTARGNEDKNNGTNNEIVKSSEGGDKDEDPEVMAMTAAIMAATMPEEAGGAGHSGGSDRDSEVTQTAPSPRSFLDSSVTMTALSPRSHCPGTPSPPPIDGVICPKKKFLDNFRNRSDSIGEICDTGNRGRSSSFSSKVVNYMRKKEHDPNPDLRFRMRSGTMHTDILKRPLLRERLLAPCDPPPVKAPPEFSVGGVKTSASAGPPNSQASDNSSMRCAVVKSCIDHIFETEVMKLHLEKDQRPKSSEESPSPKPGLLNAQNIQVAHMLQTQQQHHKDSGPGVLPAKEHPPGPNGGRPPQKEGFRGVGGGSGVMPGSRPGHKMDGAPQPDYGRQRLGTIIDRNVHDLLQVPYTSVGPSPGTQQTGYHPSYQSASSTALHQSQSHPAASGKHNSYGGAAQASSKMHVSPGGYYDSRISQGQHPDVRQYSTAGDHRGSSSHSYGSDSASRGHSQHPGYDRGQYSDSHIDMASSQQQQQQQQQQQRAVQIDPRVVHTQEQRIGYVPAAEGRLSANSASRYGDPRNLTSAVDRSRTIDPRYGDPRVATGHDTAARGSVSSDLHPHDHRAAMHDSRMATYMHEHSAHDSMRNSASSSSSHRGGGGDPRYASPSMEKHTEPPYHRGGPHPFSPDNSPNAGTGYEARAASYRHDTSQQAAYYHYDDRRHPVDTGRHYVDATYRPGSASAQRPSTGGGVSPYPPAPARHHASSSSPTTSRSSSVPTSGDAAVPGADYYYRASLKRHSPVPPAQVAPQTATADDAPLDLSVKKPRLETPPAAAPQPRQRAVSPQHMGNPGYHHTGYYPSSVAGGNVSTMSPQQTYMGAHDTHHPMDSPNGESMAARLAMDRELALRMRQSQQHMTPPLPGAGTAHMQGMNSSAGAKVPTPQQLYQQRQQQLTAASYHAAAGGGGGVTPEMSHHQSQLSITGGYHGSQMAAGSNRSGLNHLLGNVPADDILYLKCNLCGSTYGSVHNFRKHFQRVHSREPTGEHVTVQSISQTKHALKTEDDDKVPEILHKSQAYSRMSAGDSELDTRGMSYHHHAAYVSQASSQHHGAMQHQQYQSAVPARKLMEDKAVSVPGADTPPAAGVRRATPDSTYTEAPTTAAPPQQHGDDKPRSDSETVGLSRPEGTAASGHQNCQKVTNILSMIQQKVIENFTQSQSSSNNSYGLSSTATCNSNTQLVSTNSSTTQLSSKPATAGGDQSPSVTAYQHPKKRKYLYDYANMSTPEKQIKEEPPEETLPIERNNTRMLLDKIVENAVEEYVKIVPVSQSSQVPKQPYRIPVGVPLTNVKQLVEKSQNSPKAMEHNLPLSNSTQSSMLHYPRPEASSSLYPREFHDSNSSSSSSDPSSERTKAPNSPSASGRETLKSAVDPVSKSDSENYMKSALQGILFSLPLIKKPGNVRDIIETIVHAEVMGTSSYSIMKAKEQTLNHVALPVTEINNGKIRAKHPGDATATATPGSLDNDDDSKAAVTPTNIKSEKSESEQPMSLLREMEHTIDKYIKHSNTETENAAATAAEVEATEAEAPTPVAAIEKSTSEETGGSRQVDTSSQEQVDNEQEVSDTKVKSDSNDGIQDKNHQAEVVNENSELKNEDKNSDEHIITESSVKETSACDAPPQKVFEQSHSIESEGELQICESENEGELQIDETTADDGVHVSHTSVNETKREENGNVEFAATDSKDTAPAPIDQATAVTEMEDSQSEGELKICESDGDS